jgi:hypothetical protein
MITANEKPRWFFYFGWVALNVIAAIIAWYIASTIISQVSEIVGGTIQVGRESRITEDFLLMYVLLPIIGLLTGFFQYILLRPYLPHTVWWIAATFVGWLTPFLFSLLAVGPSKFSISLVLVMIGVTMALPQWWILRQQVRHASWWLLAYGLGWWMVGLLNLVPAKTILALLAVPLMPAITTCIACWLLLDWLPNHELKGSLSSL